MLIFAIFSLPSYSFANSSRIGAIILQGPHHSAQKSTSTGTAECVTSAPKFPSVNMTIFAAGIKLLSETALCKAITPSDQGETRRKTRTTTARPTTAATMANTLSIGLRLAAAGADARVIGGRGGATGAAATARGAAVGTGAAGVV